MHAGVHEPGARLSTRRESQPHDFPPSMTSNLVSFTLSGTCDKDQPILIDALDPSRFVSRDIAQRLVARLAGAFQPGGRVCLHLPNDITYPVLTLAVLASQCTWTGVNPTYTKFELEHLFRTAQVNYVVTRPGEEEKVQAAIEASGVVAEIILYSDLLATHTRSTSDARGRETCVAGNDTASLEQASRRTLHDLLRPAADTWDTELDSHLAAISPDTIAALMSTSGTTGLPKLAARSHASMIAEAIANADNHSAKPYAVRRLISTPIFHAFSCPEMIFNPLRLGIPTYFLPRYERTSFPFLIAKFSITETFAPPPMLMALLHNHEAHEQLQSLRTVFTGGASLPASLSRDFLALFAEDSLRIVQVWGMTEGGWFTSFKYPTKADCFSGAVGYALPGIEVAVLPSEGLVVDKDGTRVGEVLVRGPQIMSYYLNNEEATRHAFIDDDELPLCARSYASIGALQYLTAHKDATRTHSERPWLRTGDIGYIRPSDNAVVLVDRAKDLIKVNGFQVAPAEIEDALLSHPFVADAGVVGMTYTIPSLIPLVGPGEQEGRSNDSRNTLEECPLAFVVLRPDVPTPVSSVTASPALSFCSSFSSVTSSTSSEYSVTEDDLKSYLHERLARYKVSRCEIRFASEIPKSTAGKILREELRKMAV